MALTGRRREKLDEAVAAVRAAGGQPLPLLGDVTDAAQVKAHYELIKSAWGGLDWAILNAGVSESVGAREFSAANYRWNLDTNVFGMAHWIEAVLPDMLAARSGVIAGVSSLAGFRGLPLSGAYSASKAAVNTMLDSIRADLRGSGVDVVTICPGFVKSEITARYDGQSLPFFLETADGARRMLDGIRKRKRLVHFPGSSRCPSSTCCTTCPAGPTTASPGGSPSASGRPSAVLIESPSMQPPLLIKNALRVALMNDARTELADADVLVRGRVILNVGKNLEEPGRGCSTRGLRR